MMLIVALIIAQSVEAQTVRPEPKVCEISVRDVVSGDRAWCPAELKRRVPLSVVTSAPIDQPGKGWALLKCEIGGGGVTTACDLVEESDAGSRFGAWAVRAQLRASIEEGPGGSPIAGDSYYAIARWEVRQ